MIIISLILFHFSFIYGIKSITECNDICHSFIREVLTLEMCREAKKLLPRPKIGDFCSRAMEDGYKDACYALCQEREPIPRISQACRGAAMELPRPTVRKWCEHGYRQGFKATIDSLSNYFVRESSESELKYETGTETVTETKSESETATEIESESETETKSEHIDEIKYEEVTESHEIHSPPEPIKPVAVDLPILKTIPVSIGDVEHELHIYEGQSPEDSVATFCTKYMGDDVSGCIRQLLPAALEE